MEERACYTIKKGRKVEGMKTRWKVTGVGALACLIAILVWWGIGAQDKPPGKLIEEELVLPEIEGEYELLFLTDSHVVVESGSETERGSSGADGGNAAEGGSETGSGGEADNGRGAEGASGADGGNETSSDSNATGSGNTAEGVSEADSGNEAQLAELSRERYPQFVDEKGRHSRENFEDWIEYANESEADGVLLGGDIIDSPSKEHMNFLKESLKTLRMPYVYTLGNHDWTTPWDYMSANDRQSYLPGFLAFMQDDTAIHSHDFGEFIVVAVDNSTGQVDGEAIEPYQKILEQDKPVIVLVHVPFLTQSVLTKAKQVWNSGVVIGGGNYGGLYPNENSKKFMELTTAKDSPVVAVLAGHVHFYDKDYIDGEKDVLQIVGDAGFHDSAISLTIKGAESVQHE